MRFRRSNTLKHVLFAIFLARFSSNSQLAAAEKSEWVVERDLLALAVSPDHTHAFVFDTDKETAQGNGLIWDLENGIKVCEIQFPTGTAKPYEYQFSRDGRWLAIRHRKDNKCEVVNATTGAIRCTLDGVTKINDDPFSPDGTQVAVFLGDERCAVFHAGVGQLLYNVDVEDAVEKVAFWNDGKTLFYKTKRKNTEQEHRSFLGLIDINTGKSKLQIKSVAAAFGISENLRFAAGNYRDGNQGEYSKLYDLEDGSSRHLTSKGELVFEEPHHFILTNDGKWLLVRFNGGSGVFNARTGVMQSSLRGDIRTVNEAQSRLIAYQNNTFLLYDLRTLDLLRTVPDQAISNAISDHCKENFNHRRGQEYRSAHGNLDFLTAPKWGDDQVIIASASEIRVLDKSTGELIHKLPTMGGRNWGGFGDPMSINIHAFFGTKRLIGIHDRSLRIYKENRP